MMFTEALAIAIVKGQKTATRRRISDNPRSPWAEPTGMTHDRTWRYPVGMVFTVNPGRGVRRVAECKVTRRRIAALVDLTDAQAQAEGFAHRQAFFEGWEKINGGVDFLVERVHVIEFKLAGLECLLCDGKRYVDDLGEGRQPCLDCFETGIDVTPEARELIAKVEAEGD
jgi:hypothetical protein